MSQERRVHAPARLWTWVGSVYVPLALGWAIYVRGGLADSYRAT